MQNSAIIIIQHIIQVVEKVMARTKSDNIQINISISTGWKTEFENPAHIYSVEEGESIIFLDLLRRGNWEKYQLGEQDSEEQYHSASY